MLVPLALSHELRSKEASPEEVEDAFRQAAVDVALDFVSYIPISLYSPPQVLQGPGDTLPSGNCQQILFLEAGHGSRDFRWLQEKPVDITVGLREIFRQPAYIAFGGRVNIVQGERHLSRH